MRPSALLTQEVLDALAFGYLAAKGGLSPVGSDEGASAEERSMLAPAVAPTAREGAPRAVVVARSRTQIAADVRDCLERQLPNLEKAPQDTWPDRRDWVQPANKVANCIGKTYAKPDQPELVDLLVGMHDKPGKAIVRALVDAIAK